MSEENGIHATKDDEEDIKAQKDKAPAAEEKVVQVPETPPTPPSTPITKKLLNPTSMVMQDLVENIHDEACKTEYLNRAKHVAEEFVNRTYKYVALRRHTWQYHNHNKDRDDSSHSHGASNMINALIQNNLLSPSKADRYLEKKSSKCTLKTSLPDDVFGFVTSSLNPLQEKLNKACEEDCDFLVEIVIVYLKALQNAQRAHRDELLLDREECCAGSNDYGQMESKVKELGASICTKDYYTALSYSAKEELTKQVETLAALYQADADYAAQKVSYFVFEAIDENENNMNKTAAATMLFTEEWLKSATTKDDDNANTTPTKKSTTNSSSIDVVGKITTVLQKYCTNLQEDLDPSMFPTALQALVTKFVNYYLERLLQRSTAHKSVTDPYFTDNAAALQQMEIDIDLALTFFQGLAPDKDRHGPLIEAEFDLLETICKILTIAAGLSDEPIDDCIRALQARIEKYDAVYYMMGDLYHLVNPPEEKKAYEITRSMATELRSMNRRDDAEIIPGLSLRTMLVNHLIQSRGQRNRLGAGMLNNFFGRLGSALVTPTGMNAIKGHPAVALPQEKLTYEELEKELFEVRQELEETTERAQTAEEQEKQLRKALSQAMERAQRAEAKIKEMEKQQKALQLQQQQQQQPKNGGTTKTSKATQQGNGRRASEIDV